MLNVAISSSSDVSDNNILSVHLPLPIYSSTFIDINIYYAHLGIGVK